MTLPCWSAARLAALALLAALLVPSPERAAAREAAPPPGRPLLVTVDDLPLAAGRLHPEPAERERITRGMLDALARHRVPAVGLVTWSRVQDERDVDLLRRWLDAGHELGNHSHGHLDYPRTDPKAYIADVEKGRAALTAVLAERGARVRFFRFPFLREGETEAKLDAMRAYLARSGQRNLPVTLDDQDWSFEEPWVEARRRGDEAALSRVAEEYHETLHAEIRAHEATGDRLFGRPVPQILLLHAGEVGAAQWDRLFGWLAARGYRFATADEVLADPAFSEPHRYVGRYGPGLWDRLDHERRTREAASQVTKLLADQAAAWNRGDLAAFAAFYAEDAAFVAADGVTRGRRELLERYRRRYPDRAAMGTLTLEVVEISPASGSEIMPLGGARPSRVHGLSVVARWTLAHPEGAGRETTSGHTLLVLRRGRESWEIVQDASM